MGSRLGGPGRAEARPGIGEIDAAGVEIDGAVEDDVDGRAARQFQFGAAREQHGSEADGRAGACTDARALGACVAIAPMPAPIPVDFKTVPTSSALVGVAVNVPFGVGGFIAACAGIGGNRR